MTITESEINAQLTTAFLQRRTETGPCEDAVWSRVQNIALHCMQTGICILTCANPDETKYRQIPQPKLAELRAAFRENETNAREDAVRTMIDEIYTSPNTYYPKPFQIMLFEVSQNENSTANAVFPSFAPYRKTYQLDESGLPNTPGGVLDVIVEDTELKVLIKGEGENAIDNWRAYQEQLESKLTLYRRIFFETYMPLLMGGGIPLTTIWLMKAAFMNPHCFIEEFCENMVRSFPEDQQVISDLFLKGFLELCTQVREDRWQSQMQPS